MSNTEVFLFIVILVLLVLVGTLINICVRTNNKIKKAEVIILDKSETIQEYELHMQSLKRRINNQIEEIQDLKRDVHTYKHKHDISCLENVTLHLKVAEQSKRISELKVEITMTKEDLEEDFKKRLGL